MKYNPKIHHRRSIRLKGYDYSQAGAYFITVCCHNRVCRFAKIENNEMILNEFGQIAYDDWVKLPERFPNFELDVFQIMPNHMHGIIILTDVGATLAVVPNTIVPNTVTQNTIAPNYAKDGNGVVIGNSNRARVNRAPTIGDIVGAYKSLVANDCLEIYKTKNEMMGKLLQRNYYEHIIRNEQSYQNISRYIINNPANWKEDKFYKT